VVFFPVPDLCWNGDWPGCGDFGEVPPSQVIWGLEDPCSQSVRHFVSMALGMAL
jgi:hypothetical protein